MCERNRVKAPRRFRTCQTPHRLCLITIGLYVGGNLHLPSDEVGGFAFTSLASQPFNGIRPFQVSSSQYNE
jgi:hypothetical protein